MLIIGNTFPEEIEKYKNCVSPTMENKKKERLFVQHYVILLNVVLNVTIQI